MARAVKYDEWDDPGMAFSDDSIAEYDPASWAEAHVAGLTYSVRVLRRHAELPKATKPQWSTSAADALEKVAGWFCVALRIEAPSAEAFQPPNPKTKEGKEVTKEAQKIDLEEWLRSHHSAAIVAMRHVVTIGRRAAGPQKWAKAQHSANNRLANALENEVRVFNRLAEEMSARRKSPEKEAEGE